MNYLDKVRLNLYGGFLILIILSTSELTGNWIAASAVYPWGFIVYNIILLSYLAFILSTLNSMIFGHLHKPGELLQSLKESSGCLSFVLKQVQESKEKSSDETRSNMLYEVANSALEKHIQSNVIHFLINLLCIIILFSMLTFISLAYFGENIAFLGITAKDSILRDIYFVLVTMTGNGSEIYAKNWYGYTLVVSLSLISIYLLIIGISFIISHWYYFVHRIEEDIKHII